MKQGLLVLLLFVAATAAAQQDDPNLVQNKLALMGGPRMIDSPEASDHGKSAVNNSIWDTSSQKSKTAGSQKRKQTQINKPAGEIKRPTIDASMVGYIDDPIIGSQVQIRFDAAFDNRFPDRAEFFYAKCGCYRDPKLSGTLLYDPNAPGPGPLIPKGVNFQVLSFRGDYAPTSRFAAFIWIPIRWIQPQSAPGQGAFKQWAGISDVEAGLKFALLTSSRHYLTAQLRAYFPSGAAVHGLGTNHYSIEPGLLYYQRFSDRFQVEGEVGGWLPIRGSAGVPTTSPQGFGGNIFFYGVGPSYRVISREHFRLAPVIELVGWNVTGGLETITTGTTGTPLTASGTNIFNLKIGARTSFGGRNSLYVGYGTPLTSANWFNNIVRVEYRYSF
ncbi:MAG: hypothetical protein DMG54_09495 [Acidobacteria bacterium]|nr:MAG: hypothetical protein DMG54_09495 [Acidobacteriota bacterium]PYU68317.1 MAG: hypothetical protein DMG52_31910 [Acidobacteriota bacterium]